MKVPSWVWVVLPTAITIAAVATIVGEPDDPILVPAGADAIDQTWAQLGLAGPWQQWARWVAWGESTWRITARNNRPKERAASVDAYERLVKEGRWPCAPVVASLMPGSGGWYGQLAPLTTAFLAEKYGSQFRDLYCDPVAAWRNPRVSTLAHIAQVRGTRAIAQRKLGHAPTWLQLRALYGLPTRDPAEVDTAIRRETYTASAGKAGMPPSWLDERVPALGLPGLEASGIDEGAELDAAILAALDAQGGGAS